MSIEQLRERMPALRQREHALRAELQAIADQANDRANLPTPSGDPHRVPHPPARRC